MKNAFQSQHTLLENRWRVDDRHGYVEKYALPLRMEWSATKKEELCVTRGFEGIRYSLAWRSDPEGRRGRSKYLCHEREKNRRL